MKTSGKASVEFSKHGLTGLTRIVQIDCFGNVSCSLTFGSDLGFPLYILVKGFMEPIGDMGAAHFNKID